MQWSWSIYSSVLCLCSQFLFCQRRRTVQCLPDDTHNFREYVLFDEKLWFFCRNYEEQYINFQSNFLNSFCLHFVLYTHICIYMYIAEITCPFNNNSVWGTLICSRTDWDHIGKVFRVKNLMLVFYGSFIFDCFFCSFVSVPEHHLFWSM